MSILAISAGDLFELGRDVADEQLVGPRLRDDAAARRQDARRGAAAAALRLAGQALGDVFGLGVVQLERLGPQRLERGDLLLGLELDLLLGVELVLGRDQDHVARLAQAEVLRLQDDVERLVPGHVLQAQGDVAGDRVAGDDVEVGEVGDHLQQGPDLDVLEVERELLAGVAGALHQLVRVDLLRADLEHELVVALVGAVLPGAARLDHHAHPVAGLRGGDALHRRAEVGDVEAAAQAVGQAGAQELDDEAGALLADVDAHLVVRQLDHDPAGTVGTAAEVDVLQRQLAAVEALGETRGRRRAGARQGRGNDVLERDDQHLAVELGPIAGRLLEVEDEAGPLTGLGHAHRAQVALVDLDHRLAEGAGDAGQVDRDPRRRLDGEAGRNGGERLAQLDADHLCARLLGAGDGLDRSLRPGGKRGSRQHQECEKTRAPCNHRFLPHACHRAFS